MGGGSFVHFIKLDLCLVIFYSECIFYLKFFYVCVFMPCMCCVGILYLSGHMCMYLTKKNLTCGSVTGSILSSFSTKKKLKVENNSRRHRAENTASCSFFKKRAS